MRQHHKGCGKKWCEEEKMPSSTDAEQRFAFVWDRSAARA
jgi:hypothetical protein